MEVSVDWAVLVLALFLAGIAWAEIDLEVDRWRNRQRSAKREY